MGSWGLLRNYNIYLAYGIHESANQNGEVKGAALVHAALMHNLFVFPRANGTLQKKKKIMIF